MSKPFERAKEQASVNSHCMVIVQQCINLQSNEAQASPVHATETALQ